MSVVALPRITVNYTGHKASGFNPKSELVADDGAKHSVSYNFVIEAKGGNRRTQNAPVRETAQDVLNTITDIAAEMGMKMDTKLTLSELRETLKGEASNLEAMYATSVRMDVPATAQAQQKLPSLNVRVQRHFMQ